MAMEGQDSVVGIATRYGLDGPEITSRWRRDFFRLVQTGSGAHPAFYTMGTGILSGCKAVNSPPPQI
jgi:transposase-like protein